MVWLGWAGLKMVSLSIYIVRVRSKLQKCSPIWYSIDMLWHFPRFPLVSHLFFNDVFFFPVAKSRLLRVSPMNILLRLQQGRIRVVENVTLKAWPLQGFRSSKCVEMFLFCFAKNGGNMMFQTTSFFSMEVFETCWILFCCFFFGGVVRNKLEPFKFGGTN